MLCDFHLLDHLTQRGAIPGAVLPDNPHLLSPLGLQHTPVTTHANNKINTAIQRTQHTSINAPVSVVVSYNMNGCICVQRSWMRRDKIGHVSHHCGPVVLDLLKEDRGRRRDHNTTQIHQLLFFL